MRYCFAEKTGMTTYRPRSCDVADRSARRARADRRSRRLSSARVAFEGPNVSIVRNHERNVRSDDTGERRRFAEQARQFVVQLASTTTIDRNVWLDVVSNDNNTHKLCLEPELVSISCLCARALMDSNFSLPLRSLTIKSLTECKT